MAAPDRAGRLAGGLIGLLVGDALGVPYEFHPPEALPPADRIEMEPPPGFPRAHDGVPPGTWSDDGAQALCLLDSLESCGRLDLEDLGRRLVDWWQNGYMAVDSRVFDIGVTTRRALWALRDGVAAEMAGPTAEHGNGNGALMRVLPLALWHRGPDAQLVSDACLQSKLTHGHPRSQACCALYCLWARCILDGVADPWRCAVKSLRGHCEYDSPLMRELEGAVRPDEPPHGRGMGYVVDCLQSARLAVEKGTDYQSVVRFAVALGHDTDTTACVAGGIAGLLYGVDDIPEHWRSSLRGRAIYERLLASLLSRVVAR